MAETPPPHAIMSYRSAHGRADAEGAGQSRHRSVHRLVRILAVDSGSIMFGNA